MINFHKVVRIRGGHAEGRSRDIHEPAPAFGVHPQYVPPGKMNLSKFISPLRLWRDTI
jgi:hypothetical protein